MRTAAATGRDPEHGAGPRRGTGRGRAGAQDDDGARPLLRQRLHLGFLTNRGWALLVSGVLVLLLASVLGRRELVNIAFFLLCVPLLAAAIVRIGRTRLHVRRTFSPEPVVAGRTATVLLEVSHAGQLSGAARLDETLPEGFGASPAFDYPDGSGAYQYRLRPVHRGVYAIGPLRAAFTDPFGLATRPLAVDRPSPLTVVPPAHQLQPNGVLGDTGNRGQATAHRQATPENDDVMTREYRDGDSMRRVHWPATARHGTLMVRQEEYQRTPRATLLVDRRREPYNGSYLGFDEPTEVRNFTGQPGVTTPCFDWVLTAAVGIGSHLAGLGYAVDVLDEAGNALAAASPWAPDPGLDVFEGPHAGEDLQLALAAVGLARPLDGSQHGTGRRAPDGPGHPAGGAPVTVSAQVRNARNPLILLTGQLSADEARQWVEAIGTHRNAAAFLVTSRPSSALPAARVLRQAGWHPIAVDPSEPLSAAWQDLGTAERTGGSGGTQ